MRDEEHPAIEAAMGAVAAAARAAEADPTRPRYHFCPPANWMNDPNGTIFHDGLYHLFYQHNPYEPRWGRLHWGHAVSADLVTWRHERIALWPDEDADEQHCFSGCAGLDAEGRPVLLYTSVDARETSKRPFDQRAAIGTPDWRTWRKSPGNPFLRLETHGGPAYDDDWRDPYLFSADGRTFMTLCCHDENGSAAPIYECTDGSLLRWHYRGELMRWPDEAIRRPECPNFFPLDTETWIMLISPYGPMRWYAGTFDVATLSFTPVDEGLLDHRRDIYATNTLVDAEGLKLLAWIGPLSHEPPHWNGCAALPRTIERSPEGDAVLTRPIQALEKLRRDEIALPPLRLENESRALTAVTGDAMEIRARVRPAGAGTIRLGFACGAEVHTEIVYRVDEGRMSVCTEPVFDYRAAGPWLELHVFLDRSVLECFVDGGRIAEVRTLEPMGAEPSLIVGAEGGAAEFEIIAHSMAGCIET